MTCIIPPKFKDDLVETLEVEIENQEDFDKFLNE